MKRVLIILVGLLLADIGSADSKLPLLSNQCEEALALSAIPARLRGDATVYVLEADGYRISKRGTGPFTCLVTRNHPDSIIPECFDAEGTKAIVPTELRRGEMIQAGATAAEFMEERSRKEQTGEVRAPEKHGLSYMVSDYNYIFIEPLGGVFKIDAHMMYYAPYLTDEDIGGSPEAGSANKGMPFMNDPGVHGYMIAYVDTPSDSSAVIEHCEGQLMKEPPSPFQEPES